MRRTPILVALSVAATVLSGQWGIAMAAGPYLVSPTNPYAAAGCTAMDNQPGSRNYRDSEVEPQVAIDPTNGQHLVGAWQQDRWSNGGAHGLVAAYSTTGGASWTESPLPFSACYNAVHPSGDYLNYQRASDPWISIGPGRPSPMSGGSTVYAVSISFDQTAFPGDPNAVDNAVGAAVSYDGGASWTHVQAIIADPCVSGTFDMPGYVCNNSKAYVFNDKESVTADPMHPGVAYAVWDRLVAPPANPSTGFQHERAYFGQTFFSKTTDYGKSWSAPALMFKDSSQNQTIANQVVVDRQTGELFDFFTLIQNASNSGGNRGYSVAFSHSSDGGASWTGPNVIDALETVGVHDSNNLNPYTNAAPAPSRTGDIIPEPAINPNNGQLYVVWQDARFNGFHNDQVVISTSSNHGQSWSPPELVSAAARAAYDPSVYVNAAGTVGVTYFQWGTTVSGNEPTTAMIRKSTSAGTSSAGPAFATPTALDGPFNNLAAPVSRGYFLGDYQGLVANASGFVAFYVKTTCSDGGPTMQPSCRAIQSVLAPTNRAPTNNNSTDVYAVTGA